MGREDQNHDLALFNCLNNGFPPITSRHDIPGGNPDADAVGSQEAQMASAVALSLTE